MGEGRAGYGWTGVSVGEGLGREPVSECGEQGLRESVRGVGLCFWVQPVGPLSDGGQRVGVVLGRV